MTSNLKLFFKRRPGIEKFDPIVPQNFNRVFPADNGWYRYSPASPNYVPVLDPHNGLLSAAYNEKTSSKLFAIVEVLL